MHIDAPVAVPVADQPVLAEVLDALQDPELEVPNGNPDLPEEPSAWERELEMIMDEADALHGGNDADDENQAGYESQAGPVDLVVVVRHGPPGDAWGITPQGPGPHRFPGVIHPWCTLGWIPWGCGVPFRLVSKIRAHLLFRPECTSR